MRLYTALVIICLIAGMAFLPEIYAEQKTSGDILKQGILGAGAGAVGGAVSGGKGKDLWKGALAGAGVNIVGGAILDSMTGEKVDNVSDVESMPAGTAYQEGYQKGYSNGYKQGYRDGLKDAQLPSTE